MSLTKGADFNGISDTTEIVKQTESAVGRANELTVVSSETLEEAAGFVRVVRTIRKRLAEHFKPSIAAAHAAHKAAKKAMDDLDAPLADAEIILKGKIAIYNTEQERQRKAEEQRLRAIARKQEEEDRLAEAQRLEDESRAKRAEAEQAAADGQTVTAEIRRDEAAALDHAIDATLMTPIPESVLVVPTILPKTPGVQTKQAWKHRVTNVLAIPLEWLIPDEKALAAHARATRAPSKIPGVEFYPETSVAVSGYER